MEPAACSVQCAGLLPRLSSPPGGHPAPQMLKPDASPPPVVAVDIPSGWAWEALHTRALGSGAVLRGCLRPPHLACRHGCLHRSPCSHTHAAWPHSHPRCLAALARPIPAQLGRGARRRGRRRPAPRHARLAHRAQAVRAAVCGVAPLPGRPLRAAAGASPGRAGVQAWAEPLHSPPRAAPVLLLARGSPGRLLKVRSRACQSSLRPISHQLTILHASPPPLVADPRQVPAAPAALPRRLASGAHRRQRAHAGRGPRQRAGHAAVVRRGGTVAGRG